MLHGLHQFDRRIEDLQASNSSGQAAVTTLTTYVTAKDDEDSRMIMTHNGCMTLAEYKKRSANNQITPTNPCIQPLPQNPASVKISVPTVGPSIPVGRQGASTNSKFSIPASSDNRPTVYQTSHNNYDIQMAEKDHRNTAKMLIILASGEKRLITFTLPSESFTVQRLLKQARVQFEENTTIQCIETDSDINFIVAVGCTVSAQESVSELISRAKQCLQISRQQNPPSTSTIGACTTGSAIANPSPAMKPTAIHKILLYPPAKGGISITTEDYKRLAKDQYLNDIMIDFYLKWVHDHIIPEAQKDRTHIFSTFFYTRLTTFNRLIHQDKDVKQKAAQKRYAGVKNWTKNVNLFEKDFIIIPTNKDSHWFVAIICFPRLEGPVTFDTEVPVELQPIKKTEGKKVSYHAIKQPLILIFDSLAGAGCRSRDVENLRDYLSCEYKAKMPECALRTFNKDNMKGHCVKVPQQNNFTDCGLYLLQYVEQFFKDPIRDYKIPIKHLADCFDTLTVTKKREHISNLLQKLMKEQNGPNNKIRLPEIQFPNVM